MAFENDVTRLSEAFRDRELSLSRNDLKKALESDQGAAIKDWIQEYISQDTLLTKEELSLYKSLQESGELEVLERSNSVLTSRPNEEADIRLAIEELKKQTATIEKQTETLRIQQDAVSNFVQKSQHDQDVRKSINNSQYRAWAAESASLNAKVEDLTRNLDYQVVELTTQQNGIDSDFKKRATEVLDQDDKLLLSLQKLAGDLDSESPEEEEAVQRVKDLCARLIKHTVEAMRTRLDRIYLEAVHEYGTSNGSVHANGADVTALQEEVESLYSEILPVAQMSAEQQFLGPAVQARSARGAAGKLRSDAAVKYMSQCLMILTSRLAELSTYALAHQSHLSASNHLLSTIKSSLTNEAPLPPSTKSRRKSESPVLRRASKTIATPAGSKSHRRRSSNMSFDEDLTPELQILRNLGLSLPEDPSPANASTYLTTALEERQTRARSHALALQEAEEKAIMTSINDTYATMHQLKESLLAETKYVNVKFVDEEIDEALRLLEGEVLGVREGVRSVEEDVGAMRIERNVGREGLIERWGTG